MKKTGRIQLYFLLILAAVMTLFLCPSSSEAYSQKEGAQSSQETGSVYSKDGQMMLSVDYGYGHYAKYGRTMRVLADITNKGGDFYGWVRVVVPNKSGKNVVYRKEISIAKGDEEQVIINVPIKDDTGLLKVSLQDKKEKTIAETEGKIDLGNRDSQVCIGILSDNRESLSYFDTFASKVFYFNESNLPDDYLGLDNLDVILIDHYDTGSLSEKQLTAIEKWVEEGGTLVIGTGKYAENTLDKLKDRYSITLTQKTTAAVTFKISQQVIQDLKQHILSYAERRNLILESIKNQNEALRKNGQKTIDIAGISPDQWAEECIGWLKETSVQRMAAKAELKNCTDKIFIGNSLLLQKRSIGDGVVQLFDINLGLKGKEAHNLGAAWLVSVLDNMSNTKKQQLQQEYFGNYVSHDITGGISYTDAREIPKTGGFALILGIYVLLLSPVTFLLLRKFDRRNLAWFASPALAVLFTLVIYFMGLHTRIKEPFAGYIDILDFKENNKAEEEIYFALTAPYNKKYTVTLDKNYPITELNTGNNDFYSYDTRQKKQIDLQKYTTAISSGTDNSQLEVNKNPAFSSLYYQTESSYTVENRLTYKLRYTGTSIEGTVTNGYDFDLSDVILLSDGYLIYIGDVKKGETVPLEDKKSLFLTTRDIFYNNDLLNSISDGKQKEKNTENDRVTNILYYLGENKLLNQPESNYLIAFVKGQEEPFFQNLPQDTVIKDLRKKMECYGSKIIMVKVNTDYTQDERTFVPSIDGCMVINENYYDSYYSYRYLTSDSKTAVYRFPASDHILSFEYLKNRNQEFNSDYQKNFQGKIYFLNNRTGDYDEVFQSGAGSSVSDVKDYISDQNTLTVRYVSDVSLQAYQMLLPYISYWKEGKSNAGN